MEEPSYFKVKFHLNPEDEQPYEVETLWAEGVAPDCFRIRSVPFFVFGISWDDIVRANGSGALLEFQEVVSRGGHSTYRLFLQGDRTIQERDFEIHWQPIASAGARFENANNRFVAVDISPTCDSAEIYRLFEIGENAGVWVFEEGHYQPLLN